MSNPTEKGSPKVTTSPAVSKAAVAKSKRLPLVRIARSLQAHLRLRAAGSVRFAQAGERLDQAVALGLPTDQDIVLPDGRTVQVHDQFAHGNQAGGYKVFERYKVEEITAAKLARRAKGKEAL